MENIKLDNIDIEFCKELFEYEMTEVILKLKGEFASVSGKDTKYAAVAVDERKLQVSPVSMPEVKLEGSVHSFAECKSVAYVQSLPQYELTAQKAALPHIPIPNLHVTENIQIEKSQLDIQTSAVNTSAGISDALFELCLLPLIKLPTIQKSLGDINNVEILSLRVREPQKSDMAFAGLPQYELKAPIVTLSSVPTITSQSAIDIQVSKTDLNVLQPTAMNSAVLPEVQIEMCSLPSFKPLSIQRPLVVQTSIEVSAQQFTDVKKPKVAAVATPVIVLENISVPPIPAIHQKTVTNNLVCETSTHPTNFLSFGSINIPNIKKTPHGCIFVTKINKKSAGTVPKISDIHVEQTSVSPIKVFSFVQPKKIKVTKQIASVATKSTHLRVPTISTSAVGISLSNAEPKKMNIGAVCPAMFELTKPFADIKISKFSNLAIPTNTDISGLRQEALLIASNQASV